MFLREHLPELTAPKREKLWVSVLGELKTDVKSCSGRLGTPGGSHLPCLCCASCGHHGSVTRSLRKLNTRHLPILQVWQRDLKEVPKLCPGDAAPKQQSQGKCMTVVLQRRRLRCQRAMWAAMSRQWVEGEFWSSDEIQG